MNLRRIVALARKESIQILRDVRSLLIVVSMPAMLMLLMGYGISLDQKHVPASAPRNISASSLQRPPSLRWSGRSTADAAAWAS